MINENLKRVKTRTEEAAKRAGRDPSSIKLIVVTKEATTEQMKEVLVSGISDIGENRVKDALVKKRLFDGHILNWHMIGHLQSNKARDAVKNFSIIHSVDSVKLANVINKEALKINKVQDILVEVSVSGEDSKFGVNPDRLGEFLDEAKHLRNVRVLGLMTMAPFSEEPETVRCYFKSLRELAVKYSLKELSMGMTQDFEVAIEEGATMVRVGSAIFKG